MLLGVRIRLPRSPAEERMGSLGVLQRHAFFLRAFQSVIFLSQHANYFLMDQAPIRRLVMLGWQNFWSTVR